MTDMKQINEAVIAEFRDNGGLLSGQMRGAPILLLTTTGRRTGTAHTTPVGFVEAGGRLAIAAANGGADHDPHWLLNLEQSNTVTVEVPGATIASTAVVTAGQERAALLERLVATLPGMSDYVAATSREIPVVLLTEQT